jgi:hypothetical protein
MCNWTYCWPIRVYLNDGWLNLTEKAAIFGSLFCFIEASKRLLPPSFSVCPSWSFSTVMEILQEL